MGWFGRSDDDLRKRESDLAQKYSEIRKMLQQQQSDIEAKFHQLGSIDASIMARSDLEKIYQEQLQALREQQATLAEATQEFRDAVTKYVAKEADLTQREQQVVAKECEAQTAFAAALDSQMAPLRAFKDELDGKAQRITMMQQEFNRNFVAQDQKLLEDFQRMKAELQQGFEALQQRTLQEQQRLSQREVALNDREVHLAAREEEVRQGLASERARMLEDIEEQRQALLTDQQRLQTEAQQLQARQQELLAQERALATRIEAVQNRENTAAGEFATMKQSMLAEVQSEIAQLRQNYQNQLLELQRQHSQQCSEYLSTWQRSLNEEHGKMLIQLTGDLEQQRQELQQQRQAQLLQQRQLEERENTLLQRESRLNLELERQKHQESFLAEKERILAQKCQQIAKEEIAAAQATAQAAQQSRDCIAAQLAGISMELEQLKLQQNATPSAAAIAANSIAGSTPQVVTIPADNAPATTDDAN